MAIGRISGPLLKANLLREGVDLAFETDLLYLDVRNMRVGVNTSTPTHDLQVNGTTRTTNLEVTNALDVGDLNFANNTITGTQGVINLTSVGTSPVIYQSKLKVDDVTIDSNIISTNTTDTNLEIRPNGLGTVEVFADTNVYGNIYATGNITADGNIQIGNADTDNITFRADISSNVIPDLDNEYTLGSSEKRWNDIWAKNLYGNTVVTGDLTVDNVHLNLRQGKIYYVATNGSDTYSGTHENDPFATIKHALSVATAGETIYVYPGVYVEKFPLEIPPGVTLRGESLRAVTMMPTTSTMYLDAFHMNGEATVEDFTVMGFHHDPNGVYGEFGEDGNGTGHAFRFSYGVLTSSRSPYIRNVSVITFGTASELTVNSIKTQVVATINRVKSIITALVTNVLISRSSGNTVVQDRALTPSDNTTGTLLQGLLDNVVTVINNGTQRTSLPTLVGNGVAVTTGMLANAAAILYANRTFLIEEANAFAQTTYPGVCDPDKTKRDMGYIVDAMIKDITRSGNDTSVSTGLAFWTQPANDPRGYNRGDAGHGALIDGSIADPASKEAAMLFHSVTFLTPAAETLIAKNGARVEWLNSFTYWAEKGMYLTSGSTGFAGQGKTEIRLANTTGTFNVGDTVTYYSTYPTVLASGTIAKKDTDGKIYLTGKVTGLETAPERGGKTIVSYGNAKLSTSIKKFGTASLSLDGAGDYAFVQSNTDFAFGAGSWCVEAWVYQTAATGGTNQILFDFRTTDPQVAPTIYVDGPTNHLHLSSNGSVLIDTATSLTLNTWTHIAVAKNSTSTRFFINGTQAGSTYTDNNTYVQGPLTIGARYTYSNGFPGYIDDLRISKGVARYTSNFTAPLSILPNDNNTVFLSRFDGLNNATTFLDETVLVQDVRSSSGGTSTKITLVDYSDFGAEVRSIGSAAVYGNYGIYGDGHGVVAYLIGQNLAYIGVGNRSDNDVTYVVQDNEIVELNGAKIYYSSVDHRGDFRIGDLFYVNQADGTVTFTTASFNVSSDSGLTFTNGGNSSYIDGNEIDIGNFKISGNTFESLTGPVNISAADGQINFADNVNIAGNLDVTGNVTIGGNITVGDQNTDNVTFVAEVNSNIIPNVTETYNLGSSSYKWNYLYATQETIADVYISSNTITTGTTNTNLVLKANGTGIISIPTNSVTLDQNLTVNGTTNLKGTNITGSVTQTGAVTQTGNYTQTGNTGITGNLTVSTWGQFQNIRVDGNTVSTTLANSDLQLLAAGTGRIYVPSDNVQIDNNLTVNGTSNLATVNVTNTLTSNQFSTGDILIDDNYITTTIGNNNLELRAAGTTGKVYVPSDDVQFDQNLTVNGTTTLSTVGTTLAVTGLITQTGNVTQTGDYTQTGNVGLTGNLTVSSYAQFEKIRIDSNVLSTTATNTDLSLQANGTGKVIVPNNNVEITNNLRVNGTTTLATLNVTNTVTANAFSTGDAYIDDNYITTQITNNNLELRANGTGKILVPTNNVEITNNLTVTTGTTSLKATGITGTLTQVGNVTRTGNVTQTGDYQMSGTLTVGSTAQFKDIKIDNNQITTTLLNNDLELAAAGTGRIYVPSNNVRFDQNLSVGGTTTTANINSSGTVTATAFSTGNVYITANTITTTQSDSNLELRAAGTGLVRIEQIDVQENEIRTNTNTDIVVTPNGTGIVNINSNQSMKVPSGTTGERPNPASAGMVRFNTTLNRFEGYNGTNWIRLDGLYDLDENTYVTAELTPGANDNTFRFVSNGVQIADLDSSRLSVTNLDVDSININNNTISTTTNTDLVLQTTGTGSVKIGNFALRNSTITNTVNNSITQIVQTGESYFKIAGTNGFVIPSGATEQRPGVTMLVVGMMRFNTTDGRLEIFDGTQWIGAAGAAGGITRADAEDIALTLALTLG